MSEPEVLCYIVGGGVSLSADCMECFFYFIRAVVICGFLAASGQLAGKLYFWPCQGWTRLSYRHVVGRWRQFWSQHEDVRWWWWETVFEAGWDQRSEWLWGSAVTTVTLLPQLPQIQSPIIHRSFLLWTSSYAISVDIIKVWMNFHFHWNKLLKSGWCDDLMGSVPSWTSLQHCSSSFKCCFVW